MKLPDHVFESKPSTKLIDAIARSEGVDPIDLDFNLYDYLDLDSLNALCRNSDCDLKVHVEFRGHVVEIDGDMAVTVDGKEIR